jgi:hypothetical protein
MRLRITDYQPMELTGRSAVRVMPQAVVVELEDGIKDMRFITHVIDGQAAQVMSDGTFESVVPDPEFFERLRFPGRVIE